MTVHHSAGKSEAVIETPRVVYGALLFSWTLCTFMISALVAWEGLSVGAAVILMPVVGILFSATGILRQKRIGLGREVLSYRPVWGRTQVFQRRDIEGFDVFILSSHGSGFLICKMRPEVSEGVGVWHRHNLGFLLMPSEALKSLRAWLRRCS